MKTVAVLGTFDTKGQELQFVAEQIQKQGCRVLRIDVSCSAAELQDQVERRASSVLSSLGMDDERASSDRGSAVSFMGAAAEKLVRELFQKGEIDAIVSLGGGGGTSIGTQAMRALPIGFPKLMLSTMTGGDISRYVGTKDILMMPSVVDVSGLNRVSKRMFSLAASAISAMALADPVAEQDKPVVVASMFGNTTACVDRARALLEQRGYEVLVFHATGTGGKAMESLIASGFVSAVLDLTTTELTDELLGGILSAGPERLDAAAAAGIPTVIAPGCLDMANFGAPETLPDLYRGRTVYRHNPAATLVRTTQQESKALGEMLAAKLDRYRGPVSVLLPLRGISLISVEGGPFFDSAADQALFAAIKGTRVPVIEIDAAINDPCFAEAAAAELLRLVDVSANPSSSDGLPAPNEKG